MSLKETLLARIAGREMMCGVIGLGYVGLPLAVEKAKAGFRTIGFDVQPKKVELVNSGVNYIGDVCGEELSWLVRDRMLAATNDFDFIREADFIAICVPTPLDSHQQPDLGCVRDSVAQIAPRLRRGHVVVLESTTYPGTTQELVRPMLESGSGLVCGEDFFLGFSPERVDPGNAQYNTKNTPKVVGAIGEDAREVIAALYREVLDGEVYTVSSPAVAEMEKLLENSYRNVNIALVNELAKLCRRMGVSVWEVIDAAKTKPYGFQAFYPGAHTSGGEGHTAEVCGQGMDGLWTVPHPKAQLTVGTLQAFLDAYCRDHPEVQVDYIHGDDVARKLGSRPGNLGFLLPLMGKEQLFPTVMADGVLPRKTFSMGEARDKRYYLEARRIR